MSAFRKFDVAAFLAKQSPQNFSNFSNFSSPEVAPPQTRTDGESAVAEITAPFVHKVLPDIIGMPDKGREQMSAFGHAVWATMGPMNELFAEAMTGAEPLLEWAAWACSREQLDPDSLGMQMYLAADRGEITPEEAHLLVMTILSAGADTTVITMANAIRAFCQFPDQWKALQAEPPRLSLRQISDVWPSRGTPTRGGHTRRCRYRGRGRSISQSAAGYPWS